MKKQMNIVKHNAGDSHFGMAGAFHILRCLVYVSVFFALHTAPAIAQVDMIEEWHGTGLSGWTHSSTLVKLLNDSEYLKLQFKSQSSPYFVDDTAWSSWVIPDETVLTNISFSFVGADSTPSALRACFHSAESDNAWYINLTPPDDKQWHNYSVRLNFSDGWITGPFSTREQFIMDAGSIDKVGVYIRRHGDTKTQNYGIDNYRIRGCALPVISNNPATAVTEYSATLNGRLYSAGSISPDISVYWGLADGLDNFSGRWANTNHLGILSTGAIACAVSSLDPNRVYYYRFCAADPNVAVWAEPSASFKTLTAPPIISNNAAAHITNNSAVLGADLLSTGGGITRVWVHWGTTDGSNNISAGWENSIDLGVVSTGPLTYAVSNLSANTRYYYTFNATNSRAAVWAEPSASFTTTRDASVEEDHFISEIAIYDDRSAMWYGINSVGEFWSMHFGYPGTVPVTGDFDGDGIPDYGVYDALGRFGQISGSWFFMQSSNGFAAATFGYHGTVPIIGDFDGDGIDDYGVYDALGRFGEPEGSWFFMQSSDGFRATTFGYRGTVPITGDFDGDGIDDYGVYDDIGRFGSAAGSWYFMTSSNGFATATFGYPATVPTVGDFDGDHTIDYGVYDDAGRFGSPAGSWYFTMSSNGFATATFGYPGTVPIVGDFDADGIDDYGVYDDIGRFGSLPGSWYFMMSSDGFVTLSFGYKSTIPVIGRNKVLK